MFEIPMVNYRTLKRYVKYMGFSNYCPLCQSRIRKFIESSQHIHRKICPICRSLGRHRMAWVLLKHKTKNFTFTATTKLLHVAPEKMVEARLRKMSNLDYLTADLNSAKAMVKMDITHIQYPDDSFHIIYCSHVLEHVMEDRIAMNELYRVLKPGGFSIIQVPRGADPTFEDPTVTDPLERERLFGQFNHVRLYGPDIKERLALAKFDVTLVTGGNLIGDQQCKKIGVRENEEIFICAKRSNHRHLTEIPYIQ